jgi:hypothetical protein
MPENPFLNIVQLVRLDTHVNDFDENSLKATATFKFETFATAGAALVSNQSDVELDVTDEFVADAVVGAKYSLAFNKLNAEDFVESDSDDDNGQVESENEVPIEAEFDGTEEELKQGLRLAAYSLESSVGGPHKVADFIRTIAQFVTVE